jgi:hypothetical protein
LVSNNAQYKPGCLLGHPGFAAGIVNVRQPRLASCNTPSTGTVCMHETLGPTPFQMMFLLTHHQNGLLPGGERYRKTKNIFLILVKKIRFILFFTSCGFLAPTVLHEWL